MCFRKTAGRSPKLILPSKLLKCSATGIGQSSSAMCMLGGVNGFSVLRRFKEELPQTKVILMTGHGTAVGALDATAYGAYDYLLKPFGVDALQSLSRAVAETTGENSAPSTGFQQCPWRL